MAPYGGYVPLISALLPPLAAKAGWQCEAIGSTVVLRTQRLKNHPEKAHLLSCKLPASIGVSLKVSRHQIVAS